MLQVMPALPRSTPVTQKRPPPTAPPAQPAQPDRKATLTRAEVVAQAGEDAREVPFVAPGYWLTRTGKLWHVRATGPLHTIQPWSDPVRRDILVFHATEHLPQKGISAPRLVALLFLDPPKDDENFIHFKDGNPNHLCPENLVWLDRKASAEVAYVRRMGGDFRKKIEEAYALARAGNPVEVIAQRLGVQHATICRILRGEHAFSKGVQGPIVLLKSAARTAEIRRLFLGGATSAEIALKVHLKIDTVHQTLSRMRRCGQVPRNYNGTASKETTRQAYVESTLPHVVTDHIISG
jgi:hypothetical protein